MSIFQGFCLVRFGNVRKCRIVDIVYQIYICKSDDMQILITAIKLCNMLTNSKEEHCRLVNMVYTWFKWCIVWKTQIISFEHVSWEKEWHFRRNMTDQCVSSCVRQSTASCWSPSRTTDTWTVCVRCGCSCGNAAGICTGSAHYSSKTAHNEHNYHENSWAMSK